MAIDVQFLYRNLIDPNKTYETVDEFFDSTYTGTTDEEDLKAHQEVNNTYIYEKTGVLTDDNKRVILVRRFENSTMYNDWKKKRSLLPNIDFNISEEEGLFAEIKPWGTNDNGKTETIEEFN